MWPWLKGNASRNAMYRSSSYTMNAGSVRRTILQKIQSDEDTFNDLIVLCSFMAKVD